MLAFPLNWPYQETLVILRNSASPLDFGSSHDLTVYGFEPRIRPRADSEEPAWDSRSLPLPRLQSLSLSQNKKTNVRKKKERKN